MQDATRPGVPLLPKLRGQLAEFLDEGSPVRLGLLSQPTCVGLEYGRPSSSLEAFLGSPAFAPSHRMIVPISSRGPGVPDLPESPPYGLGPGFPSPGAHSPLRPPFGSNVAGAGPDCLPAVHQVRLSASP